MGKLDVWPRRLYDRCLKLLLEIFLLNKGLCLSSNEGFFLISKLKARLLGGSGGGGGNDGV